MGRGWIVSELGNHSVAKHFVAASTEQNLPMPMGLLAVWYVNFFGAQSIGMLLAQYPKRFPAYLQQLTMESNGKHITIAPQRRS